MIVNSYCDITPSSS